MDGYRQKIREEDGMKTIEGGEVVLWHTLRRRNLGTGEKRVKMSERDEDEDGGEERKGAATIIQDLVGCQSGTGT